MINIFINHSLPGVELFYKMADDKIGTDATAVAKSAGSSFSDESKKSGAGLWGEIAQEPVNINEAYQEYEE